MKKLDIATKRVLKSVAKILAVFISYIAIDLFIVDRYFDVSIVDAILSVPAYYCGFIGLIFTYFTTQFEVLFWHELKGEKPAYNPHDLFMWIRISFLIPIFLLTDWYNVLCYMAAFPFFHDGLYYTGREKLSPGVYPKKWFAQSTTSTALWTKYFTPVLRTLLAISGLACLISIQIYNG